MTGLIDDLLEVVDDVLGVRDDIGAVIKPLSIVTRTWSGSQVGEGTFSDTKQPVLPSPQLVDLSHSLRLLEGGQYKQGDILLKNMSKNKYKTMKDVDCTSDDLSVEKFYLLGCDLYTVISVTESYITWNVQIRKVANAKGYSGE